MSGTTEALRSLGMIPPRRSVSCRTGSFTMDVEVTINKRLFEYDRIIIIGPVFPHEVVGSPAATSISSPAWRVRRS